MTEIEFIPHSEKDQKRDLSKKIIEYTIPDSSTPWKKLCMGTLEDLFSVQELEELAQEVDEGRSNSYILERAQELEKA